jgi:hypothetical protein
MKSPMRNQKGFALITTLVMLVLALGVVAILMQLTTRATKLSGLQQTYAAALGAAKAGASVFMDTAINSGTTPTFVTNVNAACLNTKMSTNALGAGGWNVTGNTYSCTGPFPQTADATVNPDITWAYNTAQGTYTVNIKVTNTFVMTLPNPNDPACSTGHGCTYYTVVSTAICPSGNATVQFIYRMPNS